MIGLPDTILKAQDAVEGSWLRAKRALNGGVSTTVALSHCERDLEDQIRHIRVLQADVRRTRQAGERADKARLREAETAERNNARILSLREAASAAGHVS